MAQTAKNLPQCRRPGFDPWVRKILPWRRECLPFPVFFTWRSPWTEEPGRLQSIESQRVRCDWENNIYTHTYICFISYSEHQAVYREQGTIHWMMDSPCLEVLVIAQKSFYFSASSDTTLITLPLTFSWTLPYVWAWISRKRSSVSLQVLLPTGHVHDLINSCHLLCLP